MLERLGKQHSVLWLASCAIEASILVREQQSASASSLLDGCETEHSPDPRVVVDSLEMVRAEIDVSNAAWGNATRRLNDLRERLPASATSRLWLRPWLLSVFAADATDDEAKRNQLVASIRAIEVAPGMANLDVASACLKRQAEAADCSAMP